MLLCRDNAVFIPELCQFEARLETGSVSVRLENSEEFRQSCRQPIHAAALCNQMLLCRDRAVFLQYLCQFEERLVAGSVSVRPEALRNSVRGESCAAELCYCCSGN